MKLLLVQLADRQIGRPVYPLRYKMKRIIQEVPVDVVVFPEGTFALGKEDSLTARLAFAHSTSRALGKPALLPFVTSDGASEAIYVNPFASPGETKERLYVKHTYTSFSAFDYERNDWLAPSYEPITLGGETLQVVIGQDAEYPLLMERMLERCPDVTVNVMTKPASLLNVQRLAAARSLETEGTFLFVQPLRTQQNKRHRPYAYFDALPMHPLYTDTYDGAEFFVFDPSNRSFETPDRLVYSNVKQTAFTIGVTEREDVTLLLEEETMLTKHPIVEAFDNSARIMKGGVIVHVHLHDMSRLYDRLHIWDAPRHEGDAHIFIYVSDEPFDETRIVPLLQLRARENNVACLAVSPTMWRGAKRGTVLGTQLFDFIPVGFNLESMEGPDTIYYFAEDDSPVGLKSFYDEDYEALPFPKKEDYM